VGDSTLCGDARLAVVVIGFFQRTAFPVLMSLTGLIK